jgi:hypothetical protein
LATAREKLDDAFGQLEIARRSERMMTDKEISGLRAGVKSAIIDGQKLFLDGADKAYGMAANKAQTAFNAVVQSKQREVDQAAEDRRKHAEMQSAGAREAMQQTGAGERAAAQLKVQEQIAKMETAARQADAAARLAELRSQVGAKNEAALVADYAKNPMKLKILEQTDPTLAAFIRQRIQAMTVPAAQTAPGAGGASITRRIFPTPVQIGLHRRKSRSRTIWMHHGAISASTRRDFCNYQGGGVAARRLAPGPADVSRSFRCQTGSQARDHVWRQRP